MDPNTRKIVVVGDSSAGKTALILAFKYGAAANDRNSHEIGHADVHIEVDCEPMCISIWDASYGPDPDRIRPLRYYNTDISIICFSIGEPDSLENVREIWMPEVTHSMPPNSPVLLVGCKSDLRDDARTLENLRQRAERPVTQAEGLAMAELIKARMYLECSSLTGEGVREVFLHATEVATRYKSSNPPQRKSGCVVT